MVNTGLQTVTVTQAPGQRPRDNELDLFGLTHPGKVRKENQDHFMLCTVHQQVVIHGTSLPVPEELPLRGERLATILLVADGVGSGSGGGDASRITAETVTSYVANTMQCYHASGQAAQGEFFAALKQAALEAHDTVRAMASTRTDPKGMATTMTLAIAVWPNLYVVQIGDSRCYYFYDGKLHQITRDQTVAQHLIDVGAMPPERAAGSPFRHVLSSAIGGGEALPEVSRYDITPRGCVVLLCSDGLTKHVSDAMIEQQLRAMTSSEQVARSLLDLALEDGGSDNVSIVVGRARKPGERASQPGLTPRT